MSKIDSTSFIEGNFNSFNIIWDCKYMDVNRKYLANSINISNCVILTTLNTAEKVNIVLHKTYRFDWGPR